ncbi:hypothetical protein [Pedobacter gandavensis]|uniref:tRNA (Guanine-N1)-methyltransferase n=1 Tax=Pedobacter gandavensis TaxID=2679963 RepID=A0ABR6EWE5_9SPHI|nr:hypothetical protein [Pedobacter gandavensis]MBB2149584.1 hypothetical protein [Pedobacter gandavensis]
MKKLLFSIIALLFLNLNTQAQLVPDSAKVDPSLRGQYQLMIAKSKTINGYKLINPARLGAFWKSVSDSINYNRKQLISIKVKLAEQEKAVATLKAQISGSENALASSNAKLDEISFLGISFTKSKYNVIVWSLILVLAAALAIVILRSAKFIHEAKYRSSLYEEIAQEYQNYKTKANDKEKKLARELQDERNKLDELRKK